MGARLTYFVFHKLILLQPGVRPGRNGLRRVGWGQAHRVVFGLGTARGLHIIAGAASGMDPDEIKRLVAEVNRSISEARRALMKVL